MTNIKRTSQNIARNIAAIALLTALAGAAAAQDQATPNTSADLLRGPAVTDNHVPGASDSFAGRPMAGAAESRPDERPVSMREFIRSVRSLEGPGVAPELRLNDGQQAVVEVMLREHQGAIEAWKNDHGAEIRDLRGDRKPGDRARGRRGASDPARHDEQAKAGRPLDQRLDRAEQAQRLDHRARRGDKRGDKPQKMDEQTKEQLRALMQTRPSPEAQQAQIWDVLTIEQQAFVESDIERRRTDAIAQREVHRQQREEARQAKAERKAQKSERRRGKGRGLPEGMTTDEFKQQMLERIETLPPERQEKALDRLNRAIERMEQQSPEGI